MRKLLFCCVLLVVFGLLDCATTVVGVSFCGAEESNPLFVSLVKSNMLSFVVIKLVGVVCVGVSFYGAGNLIGRSVGRLQVGKYLFGLIYSGALVGLVFVVGNNMLVVAGLV